MSGLLKTLVQLPFLQSLVLGQVRHWAGIGGGFLVAHGLAAGYSAEQITGALCCVGAIALSAADKFVVDGKLAAAAQTPKTGAKR